MTNIVKDNSGTAVEAVEDSTVISKDELNARYQAIVNSIPNAYTQPTGVGAVGTYAMLSANSAYLPGSIVAGSNLLYADNISYTATYTIVGTWRCMGFVTDIRKSSLFLRIT